MDEKTWIIDEVNKEWSHYKDAIHTTRYGTTNVKGKTTACANCTTFVGTATISKPEDKGETIPLKTYVFRIMDSFDTTKTRDKFHRTARFTLLTVVSHVEELRKTGDKHTIDNLDWRR